MTNNARHLLLLAFYYVTLVGSLVIGTPAPFVFIVGLCFELFAMLTAWIVVNYLSSRRIGDLRVSQYGTLVPAFIMVALCNIGHYEKGQIVKVDDPLIAYWPQLAFSLICCVIAYTIDTYTQYRKDTNSEFHIKNYFAVYVQVIILAIICAATYGHDISKNALLFFTGLAVLRLVMDVLFKRFFHSF